MTTFAVVAGAVGASLSPRVVLILGTANLFADGFSMAAGNLAGTRAARERAEKLRAMERRHVAVDPEGERTEIREIYRAKGFTERALEAITRLMTSKETVWVETMLAEEHGVGIESRSPWRAAFATFWAFVVAGSLPLLPFVFGVPHATGVATVVTGFVFLAIGSIKSRWTLRSWWSSALETFGIGMGAAIVAFAVGSAVDSLV